MSADTLTVGRLQAIFARGRVVVQITRYLDGVRLGVVDFGPAARTS